MDYTNNYAAGSRDFLSRLNRWLGERIVPQMVEMFNLGKFKDDYKIFESREYYRNVINHIATTSETNSFIDKIRIERGKWEQNPNWRIISLILPNGAGIGESAVIGIIVDLSIRRATSFCMEISFREYVIGQWAEHKHFNYGTVLSRPTFFSKIVVLAQEEFNDFGSPKYENNNFSGSRTKSSSHKRNKNFLSRRYEGLPVWFMILGALILSAGFVMLINFMVGNQEADVKTVITNGTQVKKPLDSGHVEGAEPSAETTEENDGILPEYNSSYAKKTVYVTSSDVFHTDRDCPYLKSKAIYQETTLLAAIDCNFKKCHHCVDESVPAKTDDGSAQEPYKSSAYDENETHEEVNIRTFKNGGKPFADWFGNGSYDRGSLASLTISNQSSMDAVVLMVNSKGRVIRQAYINKYSSYTMRQIPAVKVIVKVMQGNDWNTLKDNGSGMPNGGFMVNECFTISKWSDAFDFTPKYLTEVIDYPTYEVTLHAVENGNFQTQNSTKKEFFSK